LSPGANRLSGGRHAALAILLIGVAAAFALTFTPLDHITRAQTAQSTAASAPSPISAARIPAGYVGSQACVQCHRAIASKFAQTEMGRSMTVVNAEFLGKIPNSASISDEKLNRHFEVSTRDGNLYQTDYETDADGKDVFREMHRIDWIIGTGANALGGLVARNNFLYEAPLSYYSKTHAWALSPGYEFGDYGFNRPILPGCIACHSGMPRAIPNMNGRFAQPPFQELAIGCENCHGPGESHILEMVEGAASAAPEGGASSVVNPAKLQPWLANNICMSCHQTGDARVFKPGKIQRDFEPGTPPDNTVSIFIVPPTRESPPQSDLVQHYFSMIFSKCYRASGAKLACITCHDPHVEPTRAETPAFYREKCLKCHTEKSCALPVAARQRQQPPDDCAGCHMPKRDIGFISHSSLTNHRIVSTAEEAWPDETFHMATPQSPDLVHLNAIPGQKDEIAPLTRLEAYAQLMEKYPQYRAKYQELGRQLEKSGRNNVIVLEALADGCLANGTAEGKTAALGYLERAVQNGATSPQDFERLATLLVGAGRAADAIALIKHGIELAPYDVVLYRQLAGVYISMNRRPEAVEILQQTTEVFPQDDSVRKLLQEVEAGQK